jgi:hypothetical protein
MNYEEYEYCDNYGKQIMVEEYNNNGDLCDECYNILGCFLLLHLKTIIKSIKLYKKLLF